MDFRCTYSKPKSSWHKNMFVKFLTRTESSQLWQTVRIVYFRTSKTHTKYSDFSLDVAPHTYHDKFAIVEFCTTMAHRCHQDVFQALGLDMAGLEKLKEWHKAGMSVTLRLASKQSNEFLRESEHEVESAKLKEVEEKAIENKTTESKTTETSFVEKVKDFFYRVSAYTVSFYI